MILSNTLASPTLGDVKYIVYGSRWCQYCDALLDALSSLNATIYFCDISMSTCRACMTAMLDETGLPRVQPITIVLADDQPVAVVVGYVDDIEFWNRTVSSAPARVAVFMDGKLAGTIPLDVALRYADCAVSSVLVSANQTCPLNAGVPGSNLIVEGLIFMAVGVVSALVVARFLVLKPKREGDHDEGVVLSGSDEG